MSIDTDPKADIEFRLASLVRQCYHDPVRFNDEVLRRPPYWDKQAEMARVAARCKTLTAATGNAVGKSYLASGLIAWWLLSRPESLVICAAPSQTLLGTVLFKELKKIFWRLREVWGMELPELPRSPRASPQTLGFGYPGWEALGISTRGVERLSGHHHPNLLQVIDEASGLLPEIWEALDSQSPRKRLAFGNPLQSETPFHKLFLRGLQERDDPTIPDHQRTVSFRLAATDSPDIHLPRSPRGLADQSFLIEAERNWGRGTPLWDAHVEGRFPQSSSFALLEPHWIDRCAEVSRVAEHGGSPVLSVDLAAGVGADRTALLVRDRWGVLFLEASARLGPSEAALKIKQLAKRFEIPPQRIVYDASGLGRDLRSHLQEFRLEQALAYNGSGSGIGHRSRQFVNARALVGWRLRERLDPNGIVWPSSAIIEPDYEAADAPPELVRSFSRSPRSSAELSAPAPISATRRQPPFHISKLDLGDLWRSLREELLQLRYVPGRSIGLEPKEAMSKRLGRSPDLADALMMSFAIKDDPA